MKKETAIDWLFYIINDFDKDQKFANEILDQAKEMQKEELEKELISFFLLRQARLLFYEFNFKFHFFFLLGLSGIPVIIHQ